MLTAGIAAGYLNWGKVAMASNRMGNPFLFLICSCAISLDIIALSNRIFKTFSGKFLGFCGKSTMIFMGFNYYFNTMSTKIWKRVPLVNRFKYVWWLKTIVVIMLLILASFLWESRRKYILRLYLRSKDSLSDIQRE